MRRQLLSAREKGQDIIEPEHPIFSGRHAVRIVEEANHLQDGNMKEGCPTQGGMGQHCLSQHREEVTRW